MINRVAVILSCVFLTMVFSGCSGRPLSPEIGDVTDEMYKTDAYGEEIYIFSFNNGIYTVNEIYDISRGMNEPVEDGHFCLMTADVTYVNGGVAGYVNYPEVKNILEMKDVSPLELNLPEISSARNGLSLISDYAEGDVLLDSFSNKAVWKDGQWIWKYDTEFKLDDGRIALARYQVDRSAVSEGAANGILSCEDYFVLPSR